MRSFNVLILLVLICPTFASVPKAAEIQITGRFSSLSNTDPESVFCHHPISAKQVRWRLAHFHNISEQDLHDRYSFLDCGNQGTLRTAGHAFVWKSYVGNVFSTTYPDGQEHLLGGKPDASSAGK